MRKGGAFAADLGLAEQRLRARGLTGAAAFEALRDTLLHRAGRAVEPHAALHDLRLPEAKIDLLGLAYERFFPDLFKGRLGQFFTPQGIVDLLLSRIPLAPGADVLDPTCGSGGLLVQAARRGAKVRGLDIDPRMVELAELNLLLAKRSGRVQRADFFRAEPEPADIVVANPPFSVEIRDPEVLARYQLGRGRERVSSDVLFMEALERWVRPGGMAALVLPWTLIANGCAHELRLRIEEHWRLRGVCSLPEGVFRPFGGAAGRAALVWLQRRPAAPSSTQWAELLDPGYDTRSTRLIETQSHELARLIAGEGWRTVDGWLPKNHRVGERLRSWVESSNTTVKGLSNQLTVDLADTDRWTGEVHARLSNNHKRKVWLGPNMVLVSRMRPSLGNVAIMPPDQEAVGSAEWIRLQCEHPHVLWHSLRAPSWRDQLPPTSGQTRPRTDVDAVLSTVVPRLPSQLADRVEALSASLLAERRRLSLRLKELQRGMDSFVDSGETQLLLSILHDLELGGEAE